MDARSEKSDSSRKPKAAMASVRLHFSELLGLGPESKSGYYIRWRRGHNHSGNTRVANVSGSNGTVLIDEDAEVPPSVLPVGSQQDPKYKKSLALTVMEKVGDREPRAIANANIEIYLDGNKKKKASVPLVREDTKQKLVLTMTVQVLEAGGSALDLTSSMSKSTGASSIKAQQPKLRSPAGEDIVSSEVHNALNKKKKKGTADNNAVRVATDMPPVDSGSAFVPDSPGGAGSPEGQSLFMPSANNLSRSNGFFDASDNKMAPGPGTLRSLDLSKANVAQSGSKVNLSANNNATDFDAAGQNIAYGNDFTAGVLSRNASQFRALRSTDSFSSGVFGAALPTQTPRTSGSELTTLFINETPENVKAAMPTLQSVMSSMEQRVANKQREVAFLRSAYAKLIADVEEVRLELNNCEHREASLKEDIDREGRIGKELQDMQKELDALRAEERNRTACACNIM